MDHQQFYVEYPDGSRERIGRDKVSIDDPPSGRIHQLFIKARRRSRGDPRSAAS